MSYRVIYGVSRVDRHHQTVQPIYFIGAVALFGVVVAASFVWPEWFESFRKELFPLLYGSGWEAVKVFTNQLEQGSGVADAVAAFCREIVTVAAP